jgi:hypothetical protein
MRRGCLDHASVATVGRAGIQRATDVDRTALHVAQQSDCAIMVFDALSLMTPVLFTAVFNN